MIVQELEHPPLPGLSEEEIESREETREKLRIVKTVLEQGGQFSGINRKVSMSRMVRTQWLYIHVVTCAILSISGVHWCWNRGEHKQLRKQLASSSTNGHIKVQSHQQEGGC